MESFTVKLYGDRYFEIRCDFYDTTTFGKVLVEQHRHEVGFRLF